MIPYTADPDFFYNANGTPIAMRQSAVGSTNYTIYYYITNLQGDVIRLVDHLGQTAAYYRYDPYGKVIEASGSHANINPLRYRGYYYDVESGLYYCQSRYYDPQICRFINADDYSSTGQGLAGNNMFAYCGNNPVSRKDNSGAFWNTVIGAAVGAVVGAAFSAVSEIASQAINHIATGEEIDWGDVAISALGGAVYGGVMGATGSNTAATVASTATTSVATGIRNGDSVEEIIMNTAKETAIAAATCVVPKVINKSLSGKYLKLNTVQKWIKSLTDDPYRGMYERGKNYLPDVFSSGVEDFVKDVGISIAEAVFN